VILVAAAWAEPVALRAPADGWVIVGGLPELGVGGWLPGKGPVRWGVAMGGNTGGTLDVAAGPRWTLVDRPSGFTVELGAALGAGARIPAPAPVVEGALWLGAGWRRPGWYAGLDIAVPAATDFDEVRVPLLVEPWVGLGGGEWSVGLGAGVGQVLVPGELAAVAARWSLVVGWTPAR